jgi:uncharacterized protein (DUF849 family)
MEVGQRKVVITCAVSGNAPFNPAHPAFPVTPARIAAAVLEARAAGAAVAHIHVRDPETKLGARKPSLFKEVCDRIRDAGSDIIINLTCGHGALFLPDPAYEGRALPDSDLASVDERAEHLELCRPEMASLDIGTSNQIEGAEEFVYLNTTRTLRGLAARFKALGVRPELEVFGPGDIMFGKQLAAEGLLEGPPIYQFVTGVKWCLPSDVATLIYMRGQLPADAVWGALGIGRDQFPVAAQSILLGGNVRVGLEDNLYLAKGVFASNGQLVERARGLIEALGGEAASPDEARAMFGLARR